MGNRGTFSFVLCFFCFVCCAFSCSLSGRTSRHGSISTHYHTVYVCYQRLESFLWVVVFVFACPALICSSAPESLCSRSTVFWWSCSVSVFGASVVTHHAHIGLGCIVTLL